ncbi:MAG TPA: 23S rRNA (adenine(2503)-C(2))-methyltransferase RlmN, partial [Bradyrhizobium sp.]
MTDSLAAPHTDGATAFIEKRPLEQYVAPDKPSLVGLSRDALAAALG